MGFVLHQAMNEHGYVSVDKLHYFFRAVYSRSSPVSGVHRERFIQRESLLLPAIRTVTRLDTMIGDVDKFVVPVSTLKRLCRNVDHELIMHVHMKPPAH